MNHGIATLEHEDYVHRVEELSRAAGRSAPPNVEFGAIKKGQPVWALRRSQSIKIDPARITSADKYGNEHSQVMLARTLLSLTHRSWPFLVGLVPAVVCAAAAIGLLLSYRPTGSVASSSGLLSIHPLVIPLICAAVFFYVLAAWVDDRIRDRNVASLVGKDAVVQWIRSSAPVWERRSRIIAVGGTPTIRRATHPVPRPRTELSWRATIAVIAVIWTVLYANATVGAIGQLIESRVGPDDTSTTWAAVLSVTRLIVSAVLAVAILVVVKNWRNLTWTQLGIPYQRWLHGRWERTELVRSRRRTTRSAFVGFFVAVGAAASISLIVGGMDAGQSIGSGNLFVAVIQCIRAGIFEEIGMIAIPAALVLYRTQIDRPAGNKWPVVALVVGSGIARGVPHIYYGPGGLVWAFTWGAIVMIVFLRTRRILPIIAAHIMLDLFVTALSQL